MEKWEYLVARLAFWDGGWGYIILDDKGMPSGKKSYITMGLNQLGDEGWELVDSSHPGQVYVDENPDGEERRWQRYSSEVEYLIFKRRKP